MRRFFGKITLLSDPTARKISVRDLYGKQEFHVPLWSMIYVTLTFKFNAMPVSVSEIEF